MIVVVGSGPAGISAAHALAEAGKNVAILDVGKTLETELEGVRDRLASQDVESWSEKDIKKLEGVRSGHEETIHTKLSYGSSFTTDVNSDLSGILWEKRKGFSTSHAKGGLSNIWGSSILPYRNEDIKDWPISVRELDSHYAAVMRFIPGVSYNDELGSILPSRSNTPQSLNLSNQGTKFLNHANCHREQLRSNGIIVGKSRVAVDAQGVFTGKQCTYCGLCLAGCPHQLIYSSSHSIGRLTESKGVKYIPDHFVEKFAMENGVLKLQGRRVSDGGGFSIEAERIFLAPGVLPTARIVLESLGLYDRPVLLKDSQYFIIPLIQFENSPGVEKESLHTLSQVFMEIDDPALSEKLVHLQIYGYSRFLMTELERTFLRYPLSNAIFRESFLGRLLIAQGFLHSDESGDLEIVLKKKSSGTGSNILVSHRQRLSTKFTIAKVAAKLLLNARRMGCFPLIPGIKIPKPGSGYHSGGTFPMRKHAAGLETDSLGRLEGFERVHLVDASVLPSIPATSITLSIMANAHRIATMVSQET